MSKESTRDARDAGSISESGRSLEEEMATHSSILDGKIPRTEEPGGLQSTGSSEGKASTCNTGDPGSIPGLGRFPWRRKWQPTQVFLPAESQGRGSLVGCRLWGLTESNTTEAT